MKLRFFTSAIQVIRRFITSDDGRVASSVRSEHASSLETKSTFVPIVCERRAQQEKQHREYKLMCDMIASASIGRPDKLEDLLKNGVYINGKNQIGRAAAHEAMFNVDTKALEVLLKHEVNLEVCDDQLRRPLHYAMDARSIDYARLILAAGAEHSPRDENGDTPLHRACANGKSGHVQLLRERRADFFAVNARGRTVLHSAAVGGDVRCLELAMAQGCSPHVLAHDDQSPLAVAVMNRHESCVMRLLESGSDPTSLDKKGQDCLSIAKANGDEKMLLLLRSWVARNEAQRVINDLERSAGMFP